MRKKLIFLVTLITSLILLASYTLAADDVCGNDICEWSTWYKERASTCPEDCYCGDGYCHIDDEDNVNCATDCYCGNEQCEEDEREVGCYTDCPPICGNAIVELGEVCDWGELNSDVAPDACRTDCRDAWCGDTVVDSNEECDAGNYQDNVPNRCRQDCTLPYCGDGVLDDDHLTTSPYTVFNEECDDGNDYDNDACRNCNIMPGFDNDLELDMPFDTSLCEDLEDDTVITESTTFFFCTTEVEDQGAEGVLIVEGFDITLDCYGSTIKSANNAGTGIVIRGDRILLKNCNVEGFETGVKIEGGGNMIMSSNICENDVDIDTEQFTNYGDENYCDVAPNWFERVQGCSYECDGTKNRFFMYEIEQQCIVKGNPVYDDLTNDMVESTGFLGKILGFLGFGSNSETELPDTATQELGNFDLSEDNSENLPEYEGENEEVDTEPLIVTTAIVAEGKESEKEEADSARDSELIEELVVVEDLPVVETVLPEVEEESDGDNEREEMDETPVIEEEQLVEEIEVVETIPLVLPEVEEDESEEEEIADEEELVEEETRYEVVNETVVPELTKNPLIIPNNYYRR